MEISLNLLGFTNIFYKEMLISVIWFSSRYTFSLNLSLKQGLFRMKIMSFYIFFFVANCIGSETSQKLPNESPPQKLLQLARDLFILMDSAIICIHFRDI